VNIQEAKMSLSKLANRAADGEDIVIARAGKPIAMLTRLPKKKPRRLLGLLKGKLRMGEGFDDPLPEFREYM
jgi:prevent-host-death family protein